MSLRIRVILLFILSLSGCGAEESAVVELGSSVDCDAAERPCTIVQEGLEVTLSLGPEVQALKPFPLLLDINGRDVTAGSVVADFQMQGMDMGKNRYKLQHSAGQWQGSITLPVCTASRMDWDAQIEFASGGVRYRARFPFQASAN